ncbi:hypothetical protein NPIL_150281 [Nephila pilipes]|uniref:Uncharacterized protein n=1 Tax=Nephila pilipes TaxID=299642 RepID=A0A8X6U7G6_NEPPI|nr:hypothetical protein NPIL_150281 [Nephila pilipes]
MTDHASHRKAKSRPIWCPTTRGASSAIRRALRFETWKRVNHAWRMIPDGGRMLVENPFLPWPDHYLCSEHCEALYYQTGVRLLLPIRERVMNTEPVICTSFSKAKRRVSGTNQCNSWGRSGFCSMSLMVSTNNAFL